MGLDARLLSYTTVHCNRFSLCWGSLNGGDNIKQSTQGAKLSQNKTVPTHQSPSTSFLLKVLDPAPSILSPYCPPLLSSPTPQVTGQSYRAPVHNMTTRCSWGRDKKADEVQLSGSSWTELLRGQS
jgi:hypothetical protein